jgi:hypothetical protein
MPASNFDGLPRNRGTAGVRGRIGSHGIANTALILEVANIADHAPAERTRRCPIRPRLHSRIEEQRHQIVSPVRRERLRGKTSMRGAV